MVPSLAYVEVEQLLHRLGLALHPSKTRVVDTRREAFDFLGYRVHRRSGKWLVLDISPKSRVRIHGRLREPMQRTFQPLTALVNSLNAYIRGAREYFQLSPWWSRRRLDSYIEQRMVHWFRRQHGQKRLEWSLVSGHRIHREYGVLAWAPVQPWSQDTVWAR